MRGFAGTLHRVPAAGVILALTGVLAVSVASGHGAQSVGPLILVAAIFVGWHEALLRWQTLVGLIIAVVLFVPISLYRLPANLPFNLDLYRLLVAVVALLWISSLLIDRRITLRSTAFDRPLLLIVGCVFASELANPGRVGLYGSNVVKSLMLFLGFIFVYYIVTSTIRQRAAIDGLLKLLGFGGGFIGAAAVFERQERYNVFYHLHSVLPFLKFEGAQPYLQLAGRVRSYGSAQQPIALGAALVLLIPISIYLTRRYGRRWLVATVLLILGALASGSRTAITMAVAELVVYLILKPKETRRLWPLLIPAAVVVHVFLPGAIGSLKDSFFPKGGIIHQQSYIGKNYNPDLSGGRIRQLGPMLSEANSHWPFGEGYGTRITGFGATHPNAPILDNQWLDNAVDVGFVGVALWVWLIFGAVRRLMRASRHGIKDQDDWLFAGLAASIAAFATGMLTFDAFAFTQAVFLFWILLALSAAALAIGSSAEENPSAQARRGAGARPSPI